MSILNPLQRIFLVLALGLVTIFFLVLPTSSQAAFSKLNNNPNVNNSLQKLSDLDAQYVQQYADSGQVSNCATSNSVKKGKKHSKKRSKKHKKTKKRKKNKNKGNTQTCGGGTAAFPDNVMRTIQNTINDATTETDYDYDQRGAAIDATYNAKLSDLQNRRDNAGATLQSTYDYTDGVRQQYIDNGWIRNQNGWNIFNNWYNGLRGQAQAAYNQTMVRCDAEENQADQVHDQDSSTSDDQATNEQAEVDDITSHFS